MVQTLERIGDKLLSRFLPTAEAHAACCGSCCLVRIKCENNGEYWVYQCFSERFEGCTFYYQWQEYKGFCNW